MNKQHRQESPQHFIKISIIENHIEAQLLESILNEQDIEHSIQSYHDTAFDGLFQAQKGWGAIYASEQSKTDILEILDTIRQESADLKPDGSSE